MSQRDLTSAAEQNRLAKWSLLLALGISTTTAVLGKGAISLGVLFGCSLMVANYKALSLVPRIYQRLDKYLFGRIAACLYYHLRFWIFVLIMFLIIPRAGYDFVLGCFLGFVIPKIALGALVISSHGEDWWLQRSDSSVETTLGPGNEKLTALEKELKTTNPFEFDIVDFEWRNYLNNKLK